MGCGTCKLAQPKGPTDLTLQFTGLPRYDSIFRELVRPLHKVQKARLLLGNSLFAFKASVGLYPHLPLSTFLDAMQAMLFCYSVSGAGKLTAMGVVLLSDVPFLLVDTTRLETEHKPIPKEWNHLIYLSAHLRPKLESLTPILTAAANDLLSKSPSRPAGDHGGSGFYRCTAAKLSTPGAAEP